MLAKNRRRQWLVLTMVLCLMIVGTIGASTGEHERERGEAPDQAGEEENLNRELWEFARGTPYADAMRYVAAAQQASRDAQPSEVVLPNGWKIAPAGRQIPVGKLPFEAVAYAGYIVVLNTGYYQGEPQELSVIAPETGQVVKTLRLNSMFPCAQVGLDGDLYVSEGFDQKVYRWNRNLEVVRDYPVGGYAAGLAPLDDSHLAIAYLVANDEHGAYGEGKLAILNTVTGKIEREVRAGYFPYAVRHVGGNLFVSLLGENKVSVFDEQLTPKQSISVGKTPQDLCPDGSRLYVVNTGSDDLSVIDTETLSVVSTISLRRGEYKFGVGPISCAVDGDHLYVTESGLDAVAVLDKNKGTLTGEIPTGWYPTKVLFDRDQLFVLSAKGISARRPDTDGPQPVPERSGPQYVLNLLRGTLSSIPRSELSGRLPAWTAQVREESPLFNFQQGFKLPIRYIFYIVKENRSYDQVLGDLSRGNDDPNLTLFGREITPNEHQLADEFVTLDNFYVNGEISVLGHSYTTSGYASPFLEWLGNAAYSGRYSGYPFGMVPAVTSPAYLWDALDEKGVDYRIYGENYYLYTRAYRILVDAYGRDSEMARKFYAQMMGLASKVDRGNAFYNLANTFYGQAATPEAATNLLRDRPEFTRALSVFLVGDESLMKAVASDEALRRKFGEYLSHYPFNYRSWDLGYSDLDRARVWQEDFEGQLKSGQVAQLHYIWLPNDHTDGTKTKYYMPDQLVAQNDAALGRIIETIAASRIWNESLILVTEDDAQNGPDHVDATRTVALVAGPFVKRRALLSDRYDQLSMLRTIELLLGLPPLSANDGLAVPMFGIFAETPDLSKYVPPPPSAHLTDADRQLYARTKSPHHMVWIVAAAGLLLIVALLLVRSMRRRSAGP